MTCRSAAVIPHRALLGLGDNLLSIVQQQRQWKRCSDVQDSWKTSVCNSAGWWSELPKQAAVPAGDPPWEVTEIGAGYGRLTDPTVTEVTSDSQNGADGGNLLSHPLVGWDKKL